MADIFYDKQCDLSSLENLTLAVVGYGNQGRAHALNLKDSGLNVITGTRAGSKSCQQAKDDGMPFFEIPEAAARADLIAVLLPDEQMPRVVSKEILPNAKKGTAFVFAHGFAVHHKTISLPTDSDIILVAPTGPGRQLRSLYQEGLGLPALIAVEQDASGMAWQRCLSYAHGIGATRAGAIKTSFQEETVTDLFCEQAVLCGGLPELIKASFDTLVSQGYQSELAYISCLKEVKLIADLLFQQGIDGMRAAISNTAKYGSALAGPQIINSNTREQLARVLKRIETGDFAKDFIEDSSHGNPTIKELMKTERHSRIAKVGRELKENLIF
ncbi:MAG: ketol-acid reductoisomerase [Candidatus Obscuribacterales bacterium]|nr:ketol-acid reductoisomerase [Candidatus Obscuribacterales bacterium]